jgi:hypothetical protein
VKSAQSVVKNDHPDAPLSHRNGTHYDFAFFHQAGFHNHKARYLCRANNFLS